MRRFLNKFSFILLLLTFTFVLSGCSNSAKENLENYYYVMAIGLDTGNDSKINLSVQIENIDELNKLSNAISRVESVYEVKRKRG